MLAGVGSGMFAFLAAFTLSLASAAFMARLPREARRAPSGRHVAQELADGLRFIAGDPWLRPIVATAFVFNTSWFLLLSVFAWYAIHRLGFSAPEVGVALGVYGFGMVAGAFLFVANQNTDNVAAFRIDQQTGKLTATGQTTEIPLPVCLKFIPAFW